MALVVPRSVALVTAVPFVVHRNPSWKKLAPQPAPLLLQDVCPGGSRCGLIAAQQEHELVDGRLDTDLIGQLFGPEVHAHLRAVAADAECEAPLHAGTGGPA